VPAPTAPTLRLTDAEALPDAFTAAWLEQQALLPIRRDGAVFVVGTWQEAPDAFALDEIRVAVGVPLRLERHPEAELRAAIRRLYADAAGTARGVIAGLGPEAAGARTNGQPVRGGALGDLPLDDLVHLANEAPVVRLVNLLILEALDARASDVHVEAFADGLVVRYRIDGVLQPAPSPPADLAPAIVSRLKIMADLDIAERRIPQDGRIRLTLQDRPVDVRVATAPTLHGESIVLRLLDRGRERRGLDAMGLDAPTLAALQEVLARPHGIVLATGPTGSGKTTTLYAAIEALRTGREKILTVEDPVEYELAGVPQVPVNEKVGVTFASALRALLRQDPDVLLVGEIRDPETAQIATQAALTGHLVLSTLHTNDAPGAITRLLDLGVPPYLVASTLEAVLAQRLVRVLCPDCRREGPLGTPDRAALGAAAATLGHVFEPVGCPRCRETGYRGRRGVFELLVLDGALRELVQERASADQLRAAARAGGMRTLREDAVRLVADGVTSVAEARRVAGSG
jgi:general secretion pathway protein E